MGARKLARCFAGSRLGDIFFVDKTAVPSSVGNIGFRPRNELGMNCMRYTCCNDAVSPCSHVFVLLLTEEISAVVRFKLG